MNRKIVIPQNIQIIGHLMVRWNQISATRVDLAKGYHLMTYSPTGVEATAVELQDSARTLCRRNCKLYRLRSA